MRESIEAKGRRYLAEGRLVIRAVDAERIEAQARGTGNIYDLGYRPGGWYCDCPARSRCCHLFALQQVVVIPNRRS